MLTALSQAGTESFFLRVFCVAVCTYPLSLGFGFLGLVCFLAGILADRK